MPFTIFGLNGGTLLQIIALVAVLFLEFRNSDRRWRIGVISCAILISIAVGFMDWRYQLDASEREQVAAQQASERLEGIHTGVADVRPPIDEISANSRDSLSELRELRQRNADQRAMIGSLTREVQRASTQYSMAQDQVVSLSQQLAVLQERIDQDSEAARLARAVAAEESQRQTLAANRAAAQAACAASYTVRPDGGATTVLPDLRPYGGGSCLNGVYFPSR